MKIQTIKTNKKSKVTIKTSVDELSLKVHNSVVNGLAKIF